MSITDNLIDSEEKRKKLKELIEGKYKYLDSRYKELLLNYNFENLGALLFGEEDVEYMRNLKLIEKYLLKI